MPEKQNQAYEAFYESTAKNEILGEKITTMIQRSFAVIFAALGVKLAMTDQ